MVGTVGIEPTITCTPCTYPTTGPRPVNLAKKNGGPQRRLSFVQLRKAKARNVKFHIHSVSEITLSI